MASMGDGTNMPNGWLSKCTSAYDNERILYDNLITEAYNQHGVCLSFYVVTYDTSYNKVFGEDNDRRFERTFDIMGFYTLPREEKLWTKFGIEGMDTFSMYVSKLHFKEASTYSYDATLGNLTKDSFPEYIPKVGDIIVAKYNKYIYEITAVKEENGMFHLSKQHVWEFIVKPYKNEHLTLSATTSASMAAIQDYVNATSDIFDATSAVSAEKSDLLYSPISTELSSNDIFANW